MRLELSSELILTDFHYLIIGPSGTGKTLFLMLLIAKIAKELKQIDKENAHHHLYIIDPKGTSLYSLRHSFKEKGRNQFARDPEKARQLLQNFYNIIEERAKLFDNDKFSFDADYQTLNLSPCYLIFDEFVDLMAKSDKKIKDEIGRLLVQCITMGRQLGCFTILTMIRPDTSYLPGLIRSTMMKIYLATQGKEVDEQGAIMIFNTFKRHANSTTRTRQSTGSQSRTRNSNQNYGYVEGSAVRKLQTAPARQERKRPVSRTRSVRRTKIKAVPMNKGYIAVAAVAFVIVCVVLIGYVKLQSDITNHITSISKLESRLNEMRLANDETYTKIMSSIDLEEIKRIAVNELGMKYAKEGQVVEYTGEGNDYVRQYGALPE